MDRVGGRALRPSCYGGALAHAAAAPDCRDGNARVFAVNGLGVHRWSVASVPRAHWVAFSLTAHLGAPGRGPHGAATAIRDKRGATIAQPLATAKNG